MYFIIVGALISSGFSNDPTNEETFLIPELERLAKALGPEIAPYPQFHADFHTECARRNCNISTYAAACFDMYFAMKPSPAELEFGSDMEATFAFMVKNKMIKGLPANFSEISPLAHSFVTNRRAALHKLAEKATPEAAAFMSEVEYMTLWTFERDIVVGEVKDMMRRTPHIKYDKFEERHRKRLIRHVAYNYKEKLSTETRANLENSFCIRNVFNWILPKYYKDEANEIFDFVVGLNITALVKDNKYLLKNSSVSDLKKTLKARAERVNMGAQEYVDVCTSILSAVSLSSEEQAFLDLSVQAFMGGAWGKKVYDSIDQLIGDMYIADRAFIEIIKKRFDFILLKKITHLTSTSQEKLTKIIHERDEAILAANNRIANNETADVSLFTVQSTATIILDKSFLREMEQVYCLETVVETIFEKKIKISDFKNMTL